MSYRTLHSAASGMEANLFKLDTIANNMANAGTTGFKRSRTEFEDLFYEHFKLPGQQDAQSNETPTGIAVGLGTRVRATQIDFDLGNLQQTGNELDIAIAGDGFFQVTNGTETFFTKAGNFSVNSEGQMVLSSAQSGYLLDPPIAIPNDMTALSISGDGVISAQIAGQTEFQQLGQIQTVRFVNPEGLLQAGENLYRASDASGTSIQDNPGSQGLGQLRQGFLETSNVEPTQELVDLIKTQRTIELNSQVLQAGDQTLQLLANLRRF